MTLVEERDIKPVITTQTIDSVVEKTKQSTSHTLFEKSKFCPKPQRFHEFFTQIFLTIFLVKSKLSTAKKSKTTTFSRVFHPKKSTIFSDIKVEFLDKK